MTEARDLLRACRVAVATKMYDAKLPLTPQEFDLVAAKFATMMVEKGVTLQGNALCLPQSEQSA